MQFEITVVFCNKKHDAFCYKRLSHFAIKYLSHFAIISVTVYNKLSKRIKYETVTLSIIKSAHTCLPSYSKAEVLSSLTVYFPLDIQNFIIALFSFLDRSFTDLTNFPVVSYFKISYSSPYIVCQNLLFYLLE